MPRKLKLARKHQEVVFLSDIATAGGEKIDSYYADGWTQGHEGTTGKHHSKLVFGKEFPTKEDWRLWRTELGSIYSKLRALPLPFDGWKRRSHRM